MSNTPPAGNSQGYYLRKQAHNYKIMVSIYARNTAPPAADGTGYQDYVLYQQVFAAIKDENRSDKAQSLVWGGVSINPSKPVFKVTLREPVAGVDTSMRCVFDNNIYDILATQNADANGWVSNLLVGTRGEPTDATSL